MSHSYSLSTWASVLKVQPPYMKQHNKIRGEKSCHNITIGKYQDNIISTISSLSTVFMHNLFFSQITTTHHFHTYNHQAQNIIIYMHMDSPIDLYECGTTPTRHFARVMLLDFHRIFCQRYITGLSLHNLPEVCYLTFTA